jgi:hypothetical protein
VLDFYTRKAHNSLSTEGTLMADEKVTNKTLIQKLLEDLAQNGEREIFFSCRGKESYFGAKYLHEMFTNGCGNLVLEVHSDTE